MIEIINLITDVVTGVTKETTFRVNRQTGRNYVTSKQTYFATTFSWNSSTMKDLWSMYRGLSKSELTYWEKIAKEHGFANRSCAFLSSALMSVKLYGLPTTLSQPLTYLESQYHGLALKERQFTNSYKRHLKYKHGKNDLKITECWLNHVKDKYEPISYMFIPKIKKGADLNEAVRCGILKLKNASYSSGKFGRGRYATFSKGGLCWNGICLVVNSGDSIEVEKDDFTTEVITLRGIDAPEFATAQPYGDSAKTFVENKVLGKRVTVVPYGLERSGFGSGLFGRGPYGIDNRILADIIYTEPLTNGFGSGFFGKGRYSTGYMGSEPDDCKRLNYNIVEGGLAWWYYDYSTDREIWKLQEKAKSIPLGLWQDPDPEAPWEWRLTH